MDLPTISELVIAEFLSSISKKLRRSQIPEEEAQAYRDVFVSHIAEGIFQVVPLSAQHVEQATLWLRRAIAPLHTLDALHLAVAVDIGLPLLTADKGLAHAAEALGVACELVG